MTQSSLRSALITALAQTVGKPEAEIDLSLPLEAVGLDSLSLLRLKLLLEESAKVSIDEDLDLETTSGERLLASFPSVVAA